VDLCDLGSGMVPVACFGYCMNQGGGYVCSAASWNVTTCGSASYASPPDAAHINSYCGTCTCPDTHFIDQHGVCTACGANALLCVDYATGASDASKHEFVKGVNEWTVADSWASMTSNWFGGSANGSLTNLHFGYGDNSKYYGVQL
jgi:hypothetical protein